MTATTSTRFVTSADGTAIAYDVTGIGPAVVVVEGALCQRTMRTAQEEGGVLRERIMQPVDDPHYVLIDLEFVTVEAARTFQRFLETQVWSTPANSPALVGSPRARIADVAPVDLN